MTRKCAVGRIVDQKYRIIRQIGSGGVSSVYLATHIRAGGQWTIKEVRPQCAAGSAVARNSLNAEIEALKHLSHPLLPKIIDVVEDVDSFYIIMDYFPGRSLAELLRMGGGLEKRTALQVAIRLCEVLHYLHTLDNPVIYRDLKPDNILMNPNGQIRLIDFGSARAFYGDATQVVCDGTMAYAAPEQAAGFADARSDIYCFGWTLYHLLTGKVPSADAEEIPDRHLRRIIERCTAFDLEERYPDCAALLPELTCALSHAEGLYRRTAKKCALFAASLFLMCGCALTARTLQRKSAVKTETGYHYYMEQALCAESAQAQLSAYEQAMTVSPGESAAYLELLERVFLADGNFSRDEETAFKAMLLKEGPDGTTFADALQKNPAEKAALDYRLGLAYFYCYEGQGNKTLAYRYLKEAALSDALSAERRALAGKLQVIAGYYAKLGRGDGSGDVSIRYSDYWDDLEACSGQDLPRLEGAMTSMMVYKEMLCQIHMNCGRFLRDGVEAERLQHAIHAAETALNSADIMEDAAAYERVEELRLHLLAQADGARRVLNAATTAKTADAGEEGGIPDGTGI